MKYTIKGQLNSRSKESKDDILIEVWDNKELYEDKVGHALSDEDGKFVIQIDEYYYRELFPGDWPDLYFKVIANGEEIANTIGEIEWKIDRPTAGFFKIPCLIPPKITKWKDRHIYLKIERIEEYSPVSPQDKVALPRQYKRDCMRNVGHEDTVIPDAEVVARSLDAVVYREYLDAGYVFPKTNKLIDADINEPVFNHRVPGTVIYAHPYDRLHIRVWNCDRIPHSFHTHGAEYGGDSDGAWPFGTENTDGKRSDEICPGDTWDYTFEIHEDAIGAWPFHDHAQSKDMRIMAGLFGGLVVLPCNVPIPKNKGINFKIFEDLKNQVFKVIGRKDFHVKDLLPNEKIVVDQMVDVFHEEMEKEMAQLIPGKFDVLKWPFEKYIPKFKKTDHVPVFFHHMQNMVSIPLFDSDDIPELVGTYEHLFPEEGMFEYFCQFHPEMTGTVHVQVGASNNVTVNIVDAPQMGFSPPMVMVAPGGTVRWENQSQLHHTVTSKDGASIPTHCINGRGFIGNTPTIVAPAGQEITWYVFNLDTGENWHNFHPHNMRWKFGGEALDIRSMGPAESFVVKSKIPPALLLPDKIKKIQHPKKRPRNARLYRIMGEYVFHCHVHHHMKNGMIALVRSVQSVWLTRQMLEELQATRGIKFYNGNNRCPDVDINRCQKKGEGKWEIITGDPEITFMHSVLLPETDKVLYWGYMNSDFNAGRPLSKIWDYSTPAGTFSNPANQPTDLPGQNINTANLWSAEHAHLNNPNGTVLINGGFTPNRTFIFDPTTNSYTESDATSSNRFYSTTNQLGDDRLITLFGSASKDYEIYDPATNTWSAPVSFPAQFNHHQYYPWTYLLPDGKLFIAGPHDPTQLFELNNPANFTSFSTINGNRSTSGEKATSVMQVLRPPNYDPKILIIGGNTASTENTSEIINLNDATPSWSSLPDLNVARNQQVHCILLPDGRIFLAGGTFASPDGGPCEIFDPQNPADGWKQGPVMQHRRGYHSSIIMLTDGSIVAGGDPKVGGIPTPHERYYPNYFTVVRPLLNNAPSTINYNTNFIIDTPDGVNISEVILMKPGSVTHGYNMTQRAIECAISNQAANQITATTPPNGNIAPPGWYILYILDNNRTPSVGRWIRLIN